MLPVDADGYQYVVKDPDDVLDYVFDFAPLTNVREDATSDWLSSGETISTISVTAATGLTVGNGSNGGASPSKTNSNTSVTCWLIGGTANSYYDVLCRIVTSASRTKDKTLRVYVRAQ